MPTGYDVDNWRSLMALAKAAERCATALERLADAFDEAKDSSSTNEIEEAQDGRVE